MYAAPEIVQAIWGEQEKYRTACTWRPWIEGGHWEPANWNWEGDIWKREVVPVKKMVKALERQMWESRIRRKLALCLYGGQKTEIAREMFFDNTGGNSFFHETWAGTLRTRCIGRKQTTCSACGEETEMAAHLIIECKGLHATPIDESDLSRTLGIFLGVWIDGSRLCSKV